MTISRERLHKLIDQIPDERLSYISDAFNQILRSELYSIQRVETDASPSSEDMDTTPTLEDIFRDQDV